MAAEAGMKFADEEETTAETDAEPGEPDASQQSGEDNEDRHGEENGSEGPTAS
jgi:hypothetical protein